MSDLWNALWERVRSGRHAVVIGPVTLPPAPRDLKVVRVNCEAPGSSGGPLEAARRKVIQLLGEEQPLSGPTPGQLEAGLRRRLFGDLPGPALEAQLVEVCNRLFDHTAGRAVLVLEDIDAADESTLESLVQIVQRSGWLRLPLLLSLRGMPEGRAAELIDLIHTAGQDGDITEVGGGPATPEAPAAFAWEVFPPDVLRVLRAGAVCGATFEAQTVSRLLDEPLGFVLDQLQAAADAGAPLIDRGEGRFSLPPRAVELLRSRMLPSLLHFWHGRLGEILSGEAPRSRATPQPEERPSEDTSPPAFPDVTSAQGAAQVDIPPIERQPPGSLADYAKMFEPVRSPHAPQPPAQEAAQATSGTEAGPPPPVGMRAGDTAPPSGTLVDQTRAAAHLQAAGRTEAAVEQYLAAVREAASRGDVRRAYGLIVQALRLLDELPASPHRALLRTQLLLERAGLQWHGVLIGAPFTLQEALRSLEEARSSLPNQAPAGIVAEIAAATAGVCYELGDLPSLEGALAELTEVSRRLLAAGEPLLAACLLNDQAAVYVRLGDPVRATHLLEESRQLFEARLRNQPDDVVAAAELAETHHLLARLPLHTSIRSGKEAEAYAFSLEHARAAEQVYQRLGRHRPLARVWETMGRIELQQGKPAEAQEHLSKALTLERQLGDIIGLARSTAALADVSSLMGQPGEALALLAHSIALNFEKGSPIGLAVNRRALDVLAQAAAQTRGQDGEGLRNAVAEVEHRLAQAESVVGRVGLPGEAGGRL